MKALFCEKYKCSPEDFPERAFRMFLFGHARILAPVIRTFKPDFFAEDFNFIRYLGGAMDLRQAKVDVLDFKDMERKNWKLLHTGLKLRVSHRKARKIAFRLFAEAGQPDNTDWESLR